jgi:hypothetical protein
MAQLVIAGLEGVQVSLEQLGDDAPAAVRIATTMIGERAQRAMRQKIGQRFNFRGTLGGFQRAVVFVAPRNTATRKVVALLKVGSSQGGTKATATRNLGVLLARHEEAETRTESGQVYFNGRGKAMTGLGFFVPAKGMRTSTTNVPRSMYPSSIGAALRMTPTTLTLAKGTKKGSKKKGTGRSFFATRQGIFERRHTAFGRADVKAIWWFVPRVRTPARLGLWQTAQEVFDRYAQAYAMDAIDTVIERTSPKGLR